MKKILRFNLHYRRVLIRVVLLGAVLAAQPWLWGIIKDKAEAVHHQRSQQQQLTALRSRVVEMKQGAVTQQDFLDQLNATVPAPNALPQVIERLERIATDQQTQLEILNISEVNRLEEETALAPIKTMRVAIQVRGRAEQLLTIIDRIENIQEIAIIEQWSLNQASVQLIPSPSPGEHLYALTAQVLFFLQEEDHAN